LVYNDAVAARREAYRAGVKYPSSGDLQHRLITQAKRTPERAFFAEVSAAILQQAVRDCDDAYKRFFDGVKLSTGKFIGRPQFKSRKNGRQSIRLCGSGFRVIGNGKLRLAKIGDVQVTWSRDLPSSPSSVTVICDAAGRYFASFVVEVGDETLPAVTNANGNEAEVALDLGLYHYAVDQHGNAIENPRCLRRAEKRLKKAQKAMSRKQLGSNNREKARKRLARQHAKVADARADFLHQTTTRLVRENQAIYVEYLPVQGLSQGWLAKSVRDASWGTFYRLLKEKGRRYGRTVIAVDPAATSRECSSCGVNDGEKPLSVRTWVCPHCGTAHDRDTNAARNILARGRRERLNACGADVRPPSAAVGNEARTHRPASTMRRRLGRESPSFKAERTSRCAR
jgi:putative transposase